MTLTADGRKARRFTDDDVLVAITRAERAEAAREAVYQRLNSTQVELHIVTSERDRLAARLAELGEEL